MGWLHMHEKWLFTARRQIENEKEMFVDLKGFHGDHVTCPSWQQACLGVGWEEPGHATGRHCPLGPYS